MDLPRAASANVDATGMKSSSLLLLLLRSARLKPSWARTQVVVAVVANVVAAAVSRAVVAVAALAAATWPYEISRKFSKLSFYTGYLKQYK